MARGDLKILEQNSLMGRGGRLYNVAAGTLIYAGEPVTRTLGGTTVIPAYWQAASGNPDVGTDYLVGVAVTDSTNTALVAGTVEVLPTSSGTTYLISPTTQLTATQATYDAVVGKRYTITHDLTGGTYALAATDGIYHGAVVQPLDFLKYNGKVAIAFRQGLSDLS